MNGKIHPYWRIMGCDRRAFEESTMNSMSEIESALNQIPGGRLLDVATGHGRFIVSMMESLKDCTGAVGIDLRERPPDAEDSVFKRENVTYMMMDAHAMTFDDASFDTVTLANSLHHLADPPKALAEMMRVLKPGGHLILNEMYRDGQTEEQLTHVYLHHWWGAIDTALGISHHETHTRRALLDFAGSLGLRDLRCFDYANLEDDPKDEEQRTFLHAQIDRYLDRAKDLPHFAALQTRSEELARRLDAVGFHSATVLMIVGQK
jgi:SAM-dependent methyltransferase